MSAAHIDIHQENNAYKTVGKRYGCHTVDTKLEDI